MWPSGWQASKQESAKVSRISRCRVTDLGSHLSALLCPKITTPSHSFPPACSLPGSPWSASTAAPMTRCCGRSTAGATCTSASGSPRRCPWGPTGITCQVGVGGVRCAPRQALAVSLARQPRFHTRLLVPEGCWREGPARTLTLRRLAASCPSATPRRHCSLAPAPCTGQWGSAAPPDPLSFRLGLSLSSPRGPA